MGRPPAVVIVARHGARLDAADKQWHLTSPTPYDPPLTYGGWTQCRALGARIAALLEARENLSETPSAGLGNEQPPRNESGHGPRHPQLGRRKKHKILIHSSPFLRCVQTSVAISAGISQHRGASERARREPSGHTHENIGIPSNSLPVGMSNNDASHTHHEIPHPHAYLKPRLRVDAFLGEWLSPDYYESITPPPSSVMMIASAKADLLHRGEYVETLEDPSRVASTKGHFPGGWGSISSTTGLSGFSDDRKDKRDDELASDLSKMSVESPRRDSAATQGSRSSLTNGSSMGPPRARKTAENTGYAPPVPQYALSPSEPIPIGYVNHARDACIEVDYQWDSMRPPQDWGDGGEYGEEWSAMHKRFRRGLQGMIAWYRLHNESANQLGGHKRVMHPPPLAEDNEDTDTVLILVTHGAGCNALIGALTNQPVLLDVPMASLSMAIRREETRSSSPPTDRRHPSPSASARSRSVHDQPLSVDYAVQLTASTDHLRSSSTSSQTSAFHLLSGRIPFYGQTQSQPSTQHSSPRILPRRKIDSITNQSTGPASAAAPFIVPDYASRPGGLHRSASVATPRPNSGLWSKPDGGEKTPPKTGLRAWTLEQIDSGDSTSTVLEDGPDAMGKEMKGGSSEIAETASNSAAKGGQHKIWTSDIHAIGDSEENGCGGTHGASRMAMLQSSTQMMHSPTPEGTEGDVVSPLGSAGLWGFSRSQPADSERGEVTERERGMKRRWTVTENT